MQDVDAPTPKTSNAAWVNFQINPVTDEPITPTPDSYIIDENDTYNSGVSNSLVSNDTDMDFPDDTLTVTEVDGVPGNVGVPLALTHGTLTVNPDGTFTYAHGGAPPPIPPGNEENFTYTVSDGVTAPPLPVSVKITINGVNDGPIAVDDHYSAKPAYTTSEDVLLPINIPELPLKDNDGPDEEGNNFRVDDPGPFLSVGGATVTITGSGQGRFTYDPTSAPAIQALAAGETLEDTFTYRLIETDGVPTNAYSNTATVTILVTGAADPPTTADSFVFALEDTPYTFQADDFPYFDDFGDSLHSIRIDSTPGTGSLQLDVPPLTPVTPGQGIPAADIANLTFTPVLDGNGAPYTTFSFSVSNDGAIFSASSTMTVNVTAVNDEPSFTKTDPVNVSEDAGGVTLPNWASAMSVGPADEGLAGQTFWFSVTNVSNPALFAGWPSVNNAGTLFFTPTADASGSAVITIEMRDNGGAAYGGDDTFTETFTINVTAVNDVPSFTAGANQAVNEDAGAQTVAAWATAIDAGATDESGQSLTFNVGNDNGPLFAAAPAIDSSGQLTYTPTANASGVANVTVTLTDDTSVDGVAQTSAPAAVFTITVNAVNDAPTADTQTVGASEDVDTTITLTGSDPVEGDALTAYTISTLPAAGKLYQTPDGVARGAEITATPTVVTNAGQQVIYVSAPNGFGAGHGDFGFTVTDNGTPIAETSADATVTVNVTAVNDVPSFTAGANQAVNEDAGPQTVAGWATAIDAGAADEAGQTLTFNVGNDNGSLFATAPAIDSSGQLTYEPTADASGVANVTVTLTDDTSIDGTAQTSAPAANFTITVNAVNDVPSFTAGANQVVAEDAGPTTVAGWATAIDAGAADESGQSLTFNVGNDNGALFAAAPAIDSSGQLTFTPTADASVVANVTVTLTDDDTIDGTAQTSAPPAAFTITVNAVNDVPSFTAGANQVVDEDAGAQTVVGWATAISAGPPDEAGQSLTFNVGNDNASLFAVAPAIDSSGQLTYTPAADENGVANVTVTLTDDASIDGTAQTSSPAANFTITVNQINDQPTAFNASPGINEDTELAITLTGDDGDPTHVQPLTYILTSLPATGTLYTTSGDPAGSAIGSVPATLAGPTLYFISAQDDPANQSFNFKVDDGEAVNNESTDAIVDITVTAVNDAPVLTLPGARA